MPRAEMIEKILQVAGDYRKGEIAEFNSEHVEKWIDQFPVSEEHKVIILGEVVYMLMKYYISRDQAKEKLIRMFKTMRREDAGNCSTYDVNFLRTQPEGKSQHEILLIADEILQEDEGLSTKDCGGSNVYFYLDDCIYSGNKWRYDIKDSVQLAEAEKNFKVVSYHFGIYSAGYQYACTNIENVLKAKGGTIKPFRSDALNNDRFRGNELDVMWPAYFSGNKQIDAYANHLEEFCRENNWVLKQIFRSSQIPCGVFTSPENQYIVEQAFLAVGAKLFCAAQNPARSMRPMGFEVLATIGFGTPVVTWRNIANNCPLALWYGDPSSYGPTHPLGMWYPLFPRKM
jgi:hypothetical protein